MVLPEEIVIESFIIGDLYPTSLEEFIDTQISKGQLTTLGEPYLRPLSIMKPLLEQKKSILLSLASKMCCRTSFKKLKDSESFRLLVSMAQLKGLADHLITWAHSEHHGVLLLSEFTATVHSHIADSELFLISES